MPILLPQPPDLKAMPDPGPRRPATREARCAAPAAAMPPLLLLLLLLLLLALVVPCRACDTGCTACDAAGCTACASGSWKTNDNRCGGPGTGLRRFADITRGFAASTQCGRRPGLPDLGLPLPAVPQALTSNSTLLLLSDTVATCPKGSYKSSATWTSTAACVPCMSTCATCTSGTTCTSCSGVYWLTGATMTCGAWVCLRPASLAEGGCTDEPVCGGLSGVYALQHASKPEAQHAKLNPQSPTALLGSTRRPTTYAAAAMPAGEGSVFLAGCLEPLHIA